MDYKYRKKHMVIDQKRINIVFMQIVKIYPYNMNFIVKNIIIILMKLQKY